VTDKPTPPGFSYDLTAEPRFVVGGLTLTASDIIPAKAWIEVTGSTTLEQPSVVRGQGWPQGIPRKTGYTP